MCIIFHLFLRRAEVPLIAPSEVSIVQVKSTGFTVKYTQVHESERPTSYEIYVRDTATEKNLIKKQSHEKLNAQPHFAKVYIVIYCRW